jgi:myo-inositol-1(or 4)-monophosphatase
MSISKRLESAIEIAKIAGEIQLSGFGKIHEIKHKGKIDIVTEIDKFSEEAIFAEIRRRFPEDDIQAEEGSARATGAKFKWIVDPLDGTVNYSHGFPFFSVSIAVQDEGELVAGVVFDPSRGEIFSAEKGKGAKLNGSPIKVSQVEKLQQALVATGFAYNVHEEERYTNIDHFSHFVKRAQAVRRPGSAAIDLAWVACGRIDGFWELYLKPWDMAAGVVLIREAGGMVTDFNGGCYAVDGTQILASNKFLHEEMMSVLNEGSIPSSK